MDADDPLLAYYQRDKERDRLGAGVGRLEFVRTVAVIERTLPPPRATIADIGGRPGRYTDWLVDCGYEVIHRDLVPSHVDYVRRRHGEAVDTKVADARRLDLADDSVDVVLLLGPLYHLTEPDDRVLALAEARRIVRLGGVVHAAAISRWAARLHGVLVDSVHETHPVILELIDEMERTGWMAPIAEGGFNGFAHRPDQLRDEVSAAGLQLRLLVTLEGAATALPDIDDRLDDPAKRSVLLDTLAAVEAVPELLGLGPHLLATATK
jgi:SAM-dependent methyltransferase